MKGKPDYILIWIVLFLIILGILILSSASFTVSAEKFGDTFYYLNHQIFFGLLPGIIFGWIAYKISLEKLKKFSVWLLLLNLALMALVFVPKIGVTIKGATRWILVGPFVFQPSEFLKITFIVYLASWLSNRAQVFKKTLFRKKPISGISQSPKYINKTYIAFLIIVGVIGLFLVRQPDVSTLGTIAIVALIMYFLSGAPLWHVITMIFLGFSTLLVLIKIAPYRMARFLTFLNPEISPLGMGYHIQQALIAIGSGGIKGVGLGLSRQRFGFLPGTLSDSVFAVFAEETGFIGAFILISLFLLFLIRGFKISKSANNLFLQLTALGITSWIVIQAFINIGAMISILPLTGIPLPFISYGGSAIVTELIGIGLLLNISKYSKI
ncbi:cell division protein FtsW [bacterium]|nr:cell division protein FtsW [bacterium]